MKVNQVSGIRYHVSRVTLLSTKFRLIVLFTLLILPACGAMNPRYQTNNQVRLAVYEYERKVRGPADDLVIDFQRDEPRITFEGQNDNGGRTVWLYRAGAKEFFALRPHSFKGRQLTLKLDNNGHWAVTTDVEIEPPASE
jgi:hypothetical protein